jgi:IclR family transcriptional regulator, pca regulon regulatory protein
VSNRNAKQSIEGPSGNHKPLGDGKAATKRGTSKAGASGDHDPRLFVQSVERAFAVLEVFENEARTLTLSEIAKAAGIDKSAAQRIAHTLRSLGYLEQGSEGFGLVPGRRLLRRSFDYLRINPLIERAKPVLNEVRKATGERVDLSLFDDVEIIYAVRMQSKRETFFATLVGRCIPTFCSSGGRAMLAKLPDAQVDDILARSHREPLTPKTITDLPGIWAKVGEARRDGFALALEEGLIGEIVVAAAITDAGGRPMAAVHIAGSLSEWQPDQFRDRFAPLAVEAARALGKR